MSADSMVSITSGNLIQGNTVIEPTLFLLMIKYFNLWIKCNKTHNRKDTYIETGWAVNSTDTYIFNINAIVA